MFELFTLTRHGLSASWPSFSTFPFVFWDFFEGIGEIDGVGNVYKAVSWAVAALKVSQAFCSFCRVFPSPR
jgi:hypothetical protein